MRLTTKWMTTAAAAAVLGAGAVTALAQDTTKAGGDGQGGKARHRGAQVGERGRFGRARRMQMWRAMKARHAHQRQALAAAVALTPDQQRIVLEKSRAAQPIVAEGRREVAKLLAQAPAGTTTDGKPEDRTARRTALKEARTRTAEKLAPLAKDVLASLTPDQRAKLEGFAAAHGRKLDEEKLVRRVSHWLARPMTADLMEAKLGTR